MENTETQRNEIENRKKEFSKKMVRNTKITITIPPETEKLLKVYLTFKERDLNKKEYQMFIQEAFESFLTIKLNEMAKEINNDDIR